MMVRKIYNKYISIILPMSVLIIIGLIMLFGKKNISYYNIGNKGAELMVMFNETLDEEDINELLEGYGSTVELIKFKEDFALISVSESDKYHDVMERLRNHRLVKVVEPNGEVQLMQTTNDMYAATQWSLRNEGSYRVLASGVMREMSATKDIDMDVIEAWEYMSQDMAERREVVVAIIDTGVDYNHPDLSGRIWINPNEIPNDGIDNDNNGYIDDIYGWDFYNDDPSVCHYKFDKKSGLNLALPEDNDNHGTHIAGIIGAVANNEIGIAGIASNIDLKIMSLKINGGSDGNGNISDAILAIKYATAMGADICNISWGTTHYSTALLEAIKESDMLFVAAAGNGGNNNDKTPIYPADFKLDNLISTTFIDANGMMTRLSNYGKKSIEIAAPGADILSTIVGTYQTLSGSSMAAPHVTAVASLLYSYNDKFYPSAVKDIIIKTIKPIDGLENKVIHAGIPNAYDALMEVDNIVDDIWPPNINLTTIFNKNEFIIPVKVEDIGRSDIRVIRWLAGSRKVADFNRGTAGLAVDNNKITVAKSGAYTVYAGDYAGNESVRIIEIEDDVTPPKISLSYSVSENYKTRTINIRVVDGQSGIRRVKILEGIKKESDFLPANSGTEIILENSRAFYEVKKDGIYTLYAIDNRGNHIVKPIEVKTILSSDLKFARTDKVITVGEDFYLRAFIKPSNSTDIITYTSSDTRVATINSKGKVVAHSEGITTITARTNNGLKAVCRVIVIKKNP